MKRLTLWVISTVVAGCAAPSPSRLEQNAEIAPSVYANYPVPKQVHYSFTLRNGTSQVVRNAEFWTYAPVKQTSTQVVEKVHASHPFRTNVDRFGNQILFFSFADIPPFGSKVISVRADLRMATTPRAVDGGGSEGDFLAPEPRIESNEKNVVDVASGLKSDLPVQTAASVYDWIVRNLKAQTFIAEDLGAAYAIKNKYGDCTEFAALFTAMTRANAIPARMMGGYVSQESAVLKAADYHNWSEFFASGAWHIADPQKQKFMPAQGDYVAMRIIKADSATAAFNSHRFHSAGDGLTVTMN